MISAATITVTNNDEYQNRFILIANVAVFFTIVLLMQKYSESSRILKNTRIKNIESSKIRPKENHSRLHSSPPTTLITHVCMLCV